MVAAQATAQGETSGAVLSGGYGVANKIIE